jgi:hypothetical protein
MEHVIDAGSSGSNPFGVKIALKSNLTQNNPVELFFNDYTHLARMALDVVKGEVPPQSLRAELSASFAEANLVQAYTSSVQTQKEGPLSNSTTALVHTPRPTRLAKIIAEGKPEILEKEVKLSLKFLEKLIPCLKAIETEIQPSQYWIQEISKSILVI